MSEQNKDNISEFFRKAVQKPKISFEESDWEKLEAKLDAASRAGVAKPNHWKTAFIAAAALLFVSTSLLLYTSRQVSTLTKKTELEKVNQHPAVSTSPSSKNEKHSERQEPKSMETKKPDEKISHSSLLSYVIGKVVKAQPMNNITKVSTSPLTSLQNDDEGMAALTQPADASSNVSKGAVMNQSSNKKVTSQSPAVDSASVKEKGAQKDTVKNKKSLEDSLNDLIKSKPSRWNVMLSLSPDFSTTDLDKFTTPGAAFGIAAYYAINNRFSVSAGVVKSSKYYWDDGYEYQPVQAGFWAKKTNGIVPTKIDGSCSVLEIPLGLQYYAMSTKKNKLYVASTFSSYIMLHESYQYIFDAPNPGAAESWSAKKVSYNLFSVANFAVGYERSISNRLMIGVAPYLKIPLSAIGAWANVKLYSTGASFTLRYQFQKKKKPDRLIPAD